jgi:hypothetical protein
VGCISSLPVTITQPTPLTSTKVVTNVLCNGASTGSVVINPSGGVGPYTIAPAQTGLAAGTYTFTVTDANGCTLNVPVTITQPAPLTSTQVVTNVSCNGASTGSVVINPSGGAGPYTIAPAQTGLAAGTNTFTVTDANGCTLNVPVTITQPAPLTTTQVITNVLCNGAATGSVVFNPSGGVGPYTIAPAQTGLAAGTYTFTVTDATGCILNVPVTITQPTPLTSTQVVTNVSCNGGSTGSVVITPAGGVGPYTIAPAQTGLAAGTYTFTVTDANGCTLNVPVTITQPAVITATTAITNVLCNGASTGSVIITPAGGVGPYSIAPAQTGLAAGTYAFTITDANGCTLAVPATLTQPAVITATTAITNVLCNGASTGSVIITPGGGVGPYTIAPAQTGLAAGAYAFTVTDANGCTLNVPVTITQPPVITATTAITNVLCNGTSTGSVIITPAGGVGPYTITPAQTGLVAGTYTFTVTDANGCAIAVPVTVTEPAAVTPGQEIITICEASLPYSWNNQNITVAGDYTAALVSAAGCDSVAMLHLIINPVVTGEETIRLCQGQLPYTWNNQSITATGDYITTLLNIVGCDSVATLHFIVNPNVTGQQTITICQGQLPYIWNGQNITAAGNYNATLVSAAGCDSVATLHLIVNPNVTGQQTITICQGQLPYSWNTQSITAAGNYNATLVSAAGCDSVATLHLIVNPNVTGQQTITICQGQLPYSWNTQIITGAGNYNATLVSAAGCDSVATLHLIVNPNVTGQQTITICQGLLPYTWNGQNITAAGNYNATLVSAVGCDSVATLHLIVNPNVTGQQTITICQGQLPYTWNRSKHYSSR